MTMKQPTSEFLAGLAAANAGRPSRSEQTPEQVRLGYLGLSSILGNGPDLEEVIDSHIKQIPVRIYRSETRENAPCVLFFHGGGWVIGDLQTHDRECRKVAQGANCTVISVDYRLAPEHPFPAAHDDCLAVLKYVYQHASSLRINKQKIALVGESAGGSLTAFLALKARDLGIPIIKQVMLYPVTDARPYAPDSDVQPTASALKNTLGPLLTRETMHFFLRHTCAGIDASEACRDWRLSPLLATDHSNLAPAFLATCELDPLCDEGDAYADKLQQAGVEVEHKCWQGQPHSLMQFSNVLDAGQALMTEITASLIAAFKRTDH
ncbi:MAG: alpha/beta hydrolase [Gammaproteobacteria bacterium]|jgi:acetyl esterase|nr:alpha/beta hydrolase [Gammaproteobacteria bacterium]MBT5203516.1 alpha/beta hydrolase [Gammaproteobacteria bacterium]MBT5600964.1 alpha/beta hydrolase [Gammaproteobacteria bacterium]MBT6245317.1 alpha/beta hydrolase [Gammaproteobacteria bacterium]